MPDGAATCRDKGACVVRKGASSVMAYQKGDESVRRKGRVMSRFAEGVQEGAATCQKKGTCVVVMLCNGLQMTGERGV